MKTFGKILGCVLTVATLGAATPAYAYPGIRHYYVFYAAVESTEVVGYISIYCDDTTIATGQITPYYYEEHEDC